MLLLLCILVAASRSDARPNIVLIIADDLGWNDVGFHGLNQIPTPNIDALAYSGLVLQNYYVTPICTPSRSALMTGKYPIHIGMQRGVIYGTSQRGLPLSEKILPQYLKDLGYRTHLVGKWHLGHYKKEYLPLNRGFDSHTGFWTGKIDMYDHTNMETALWGHDFRRGFQVAYDLFGKYATDIYTTESIKVINAHNKSEPLFLTIAHSAVHSGNPNEPIRAPDNVIDNFTNIENYQRRKFAGVLTKLDESVGKVVESLQKNGLLENSIVIFTTDNGGPAQGFNDNAASNYPLKGVKNTLWEGGVRGAALLWSPLLKQRSRVAAQRMHIVDWLPTLLAAVGQNTSVFKDIDGINQWEALSHDQQSERRILVHNIDDAEPSAAITVDQWKLHKGTTYKGNWDSWYGPNGRDGTYDIQRVLNARAGAAITKLALMPNEEKILQIRSAATIQCNTSIPVTECKPLKAACLYNIEMDPCERNNLADQEPEVVQTMLNHLDAVNKTAIPPQDNKLDPRGNPKYWGAVFTNFADYERPNPTNVGAKPAEHVTCL